MTSIRRQRESTSDELLLMNALQLQPIAAASACILTRSALRDDALGMQFARLLKHHTAVRLNMLTEAQIFARAFHHSLQHLLALDQRQTTNRMPVQMKQI